MNFDTFRIVVQLSWWVNNFIKKNNILRNGLSGKLREFIERLKRCKVARCPWDILTYYLYNEFLCRALLGTLY